MKAKPAARLLAHLQALVGQEAIYREGGLIKHVRLVKPDIDDGLLTLWLEPLPSPGFSARAGTPFQASVALECLTEHSRYLAAPIVNWCLVTHPQATMHLVALAQGGAQTDALQTAYIGLRRRSFAMPAD
jgi:hypothetical protein